MKKSRSGKDIVLFLNTSKDKNLDVFLIKNNRILSQDRRKGDFKVSDLLLESIDSLLSKKGLSWHNLGGIIIVSGPGAFTSLRIAVIIANTLSYILKIPACGVRVKKEGSTNKELIGQGLNDLKKTKVGKRVTPYYGQEPNITLKKK